jgi:flagellar motor switch protein FliN/FliY
MPESSAIDVFGRLPLTVEVRVGGRDLTLDGLLELEIGSIISLDRPAGETLEVRVGNVSLASAEIVALEDRLAVRITDFDPWISVPRPESVTPE